MSVCMFVLRFDGGSWSVTINGLGRPQRDQFHTRFPSELRNGNRTVFIGMEIEPQFYKVHTQSPDEIMHLIVPYLNFLGGFGYEIKGFTSNYEDHGKRTLMWNFQRC
ncbi:hypothetical protein Fcan01_25632 [Folsomia candida]|uniref:Uncharacterized protein n=1 Tax=Folsomia candida TaxID=158441 RepID=A0A226D451_FOLCA|nr:hypothetical protein Fcan01_25632 [Folsomia candida]